MVGVEREVSLGLGPEELRDLVAVAVDQVVGEGGLHHQDLLDHHQDLHLEVLLL